MTIIYYLYSYVKFREVLGHKKSQKEKSFWLLKKIGNSTDYLFENCGDLLAFLFPGFFLSTTLASLVSKP